MNHLTQLSLILLVAVMAVQPSEAKGGQARGPHGEMREALKTLNLSEEQKEKIKELRKASAETHKETRAALKEGRKAIEEAMKSEAKKADILAKFDAMAALRQKIGRARFETMLDVREILTPEQRHKFHAFMESHKGKRLKQQDAEQD